MHIQIYCSTDAAKRKVLIENGLRFTLAINSGIIILNIANQPDLRARLVCFFTRKADAKRSIYRFGTLL